MDRKSSSGRKKRVTSGGGNARRRGSGIGSGRPVGRRDGYAGRRQSSGSSGGGYSSGGSGSSGSRSALGGLLGALLGGRGKSSWLRRIIVIAIIGVALYFLFSSVFQSCGAEEAAQTDAGQNSIAASEENVLAESQSGSDDSAQLNTTVSNEACDKRTQIKGNGEDVYTIMVYMCGSDLESKYGMGTADLNEMIKATVGDKVNLIIETGGARTWQNDKVSNQTNQRYRVFDDGVKLVQDNLGQRPMTDPATLADFIQYCKAEYPADRFGLIFWDHGAGSLSGFGYDEFAPGTSMTLDEIDAALKSGGCVFDFVGFDACLMATFETAVVLNRYSDYMIASEEIEPGIGWYYTDWLTALSKNTSMSTPELGKNIIDTFVEACYANNREDKTTLSIVDLAELSGTVPEAFGAFAGETAMMIEEDEYDVVSDARSDAKEFGTPTVKNQIDLIHLAQNLGTPEALALEKALKGCIKYNRTSSNISNANGLSIYFPYGRLNSLDPMLDTYEKIGMDDEYSEAIKSFANVNAGGQIVSSGSGNPLGSLLGEFIGSQGGAETITGLLGSFLEGGDIGSVLGGAGGDTFDWFERGNLRENVQYVRENYLNQGDLALEEKNGYYVLKLSDEQLELVQNIMLNVFLDDGEGFIDLGLDNVYEFDEDGDLVIGYDGTWLAIEGQIVAYYFMSEDRDGENYTITGRVPAMLNGTLVDIILVFDNDDPYGKVAGAREMYAEEETATVAKGLIPIVDGDKIDFLCDYYSYDEQYTDSFYLGEQLTVSGELFISNVNVGDMDAKVTYLLQDIYSNEYWTPAVTF